MKSTLKIDTRVRSLRSYLEEFEKGVFQVPSFQRDFLWDVNAIIQLFDSIKNKYPIGSIQFWQPIEEGQRWIERDVYIGPFKVLNTSTEPKPIFILDGLQRLSSLFGCLVNPEKYNKQRLQLDINRLNEKFRVYYDLETEEFFALRKNQKNTLHHQVPLYVLISTSDFRKFSREKLEKIEDKSKVDVYLDRADELSKIISEYEIASVDILNARVEEAVEIFWRVNAKGQPISKDWIVNALSSRSDFRLSKEIDKLLEKVKIYNFREDRRELLVNSIFSSFGKIYYDVDTIKLVKQSVENFINTTRKSLINIEKAIEFLFKECYVIDSKTLPSQFQLIFITEFFNIVETPTTQQREGLKKWFWFTTYSNYFTIYNAPSKIRKIFEQFRNYFLGSENDLIYIEREDAKIFSPKYKPSNFGSVRFCANVLFQLSQTREIIKTDNCLGFESIKLLEGEDGSLGNIIYKPIVINDAILNYQNKKHTSLQFLLSNEFRGQYDELFITDEMRDLYIKKSNRELLEMREKLICQKEKAFVESLGIEYEE